MNACDNVQLPKMEVIFNGLLFDRRTNTIHTSCGTKIGQVKNGKIKWDKFFKQSK